MKLVNLDITHKVDYQTFIVMAFFSVNQKDFQQILNFCNQISPKRSDIDVLTFTKFELKDNQVVVSSFNSSFFYNTHLKVASLELEEGVETSFLVKTDIIASSVSLITDELVGLEVDLEKLTLLIQGSKSKHKLRIDTSNLKDFKLPEESSEDLENSVTLSSLEFLEANRASLISVGQPKNVYQPEFLNICYQVKATSKEFLVVSTDRFRVTKTVLVGAYDPVESQGLELEESKNYLLNSKNLTLLDTFLNTEESIQLYFHRNFLWVKLATATLILGYSDGKYPDFEKIIPQSFTCSFIVESKEILGSLKQVYLFAKSNTANKSVTLKVLPAESKLIFSAETSDGYASESSVDVTNYEGVSEEWSQAFNADYLIDYISLLSTEKFLWEANPGKPSILSPENQKNRQLYLVSGLR